MAINENKWLRQLIKALELTRKCLPELHATLIDQGFESDFHVDLFDESERDYQSGILLFSRLLDEVKKGLALVESVRKDHLHATDLDVQRTLDEFALRQRKLFEALLSVVFLSRQELFVNGKASLYFWHYHIIDDYEQLRLRNTDLAEFFGGPCPALQHNMKYCEHILTILSNQIDSLLCGWAAGCKPKNTKDQFIDVIRHDATDLEKFTLGAGYRAVFGNASDQIHLNMSGFYSSVVEERLILQSIETVLLLCICIVLRTIKISTNLKPIGPESSILQSMFGKELPNKLITAILGSADVEDFVSVFDAKGTFIGVVNKKLHGQYTAYEILPFSNAGCWGTYPDGEIMLLVTKQQQDTLHLEAVERGFLQEHVLSQNNAYIFDMLTRNQTAVTELVMPAINANRPTVRMLVKTPLGS